MTDLKKKTREFGIFQLFGNLIANDTNVHLLLNPELPWQKQRSTRIISAPANRT